jgi:hypothetical protein
MSALVNKLLWNAVMDQLQIMMFCEQAIVRSRGVREIESYSLFETCACVLSISVPIAGGIIVKACEGEK